MILKKDFNLEKITHFTLNKIKREDIVNYPDNINESYQTDLSFGGYGEVRSFYDGKEKIIHTGLDVFLDYTEKIFFPFDGLISEVVYCNPQKYQIGNGTGTQVIVWHSFNQVEKTLGFKKTKAIFKNKKYLKVIYIHLDFNYFKNNIKLKFKNSKLENNILKYCILNKEIKMNDLIGLIGNRFNNGGWAPHVHIEASLHDVVEKINFKDSKDIINKIAIGTVLYKNKDVLSKYNLVDPNLFLGFDKITTEKIEMNLNNIKKQKKLISIKNLSFSYDKNNLVLDNINFKINNGEIVSILGPSGCGKTSLLNAIAGFIDYKGIIEKENINSYSDIGYVFQDNVIYNSISVYKNIYLGALNNLKYKFQLHLKIWKKSKLKLKDFEEMQNVTSLFKMYNEKNISQRIFINRFKKFIKMFNKNYFKIDFKEKLNEDVKKIMNILKIKEIASHKPSQISGGQKQRVAIAKSMIKKPNILIMDEPLSSLDAKIKDKTRNWIKEIQKYFNITLIFVTHDQNDALLISDKILLMNKGKVEQFSTPQEIFDNPISEFAAKFIGWPEINLVKTIKNKKIYIRPQHIKISLTQKSNFEIKDIRSLGTHFLYEGFYQNKKIVIYSKNKYKINQKVYIYWKKEKEIVFYNNDKEKK